MEHLMIEEIVKFVTLKKVDAALCGKVNAHMCECTECRRKVRETRKLYEALNGIKTTVPNGRGEAENAYAQ